MHLEDAMKEEEPVNVQAYYDEKSVSYWCHHAHNVYSLTTESRNKKPTLNERRRNLPY